MNRLADDSHEISNNIFTGKQNKNLECRPDFLRKIKKECHLVQFWCFNG